MRSSSVTERRLAPIGATQRDHIGFVLSFAPLSSDRRGCLAFLGPPDRERRAVADHQLSVSALRFFFTVTLDPSDLSRRFVLVRRQRNSRVPRPFVCLVTTLRERTTSGLFGARPSLQIFIARTPP